MIAAVPQGGDSGSVGILPARGRLLVSVRRQQIGTEREPVRRDRGTSSSTARDGEVAYEELISKWWLEPELNRRHKDFQSSALPTELSSHLRINSV